MTRLILAILTAAFMVSISVRSVAEEPKQGYLGAVFKQHYGKYHRVEIEFAPEDRPAFKGGLREGDIITGFDGFSVDRTETLSKLIRDTPPGK